MCTILENNFLSLDDILYKINEKIYIRKFDHKSLVADNIVVLGGGPSVRQNTKNILTYCEMFNPVVFSAHYQHKEIPIDFVFYVSRKKYRSLIWNIKAHNIVISPYIFRENTKFRQDKNYFYISHELFGRYDTNEISVYKNHFSHFVGNSGMAAILCASFFRPKQILLCGFDGPSEDLTWIAKKNGQPSFYNELKEERKEKIYFFNNVIMDFLKNSGAKIVAFPEDQLWGTNKEKYGIVNFTSLIL